MRSTGFIVTMLAIVWWSLPASAQILFPDGSQQIRGLGGTDNTITGLNATVAGGTMNEASGPNATVGGGNLNIAGGDSSTIAGGFDNQALTLDSSIGGGSVNTATGGSAAISGGFTNEASGDSAFVGGGATNLASGETSVVGGGFMNTASFQDSFVGGGDRNVADGLYSVVAGGKENEALEEGATIGGGNLNTATGIRSVVPGGNQNTAGGNVSFAAGNGATVASVHDGVFLFSDTHPYFFNSVAAKEFAVRATGGVRFVTGINLSTGAPTTGVKLNPGASSWSNLSDRNAKENFEDVDGKEVLRKVAAVPVATWNYKSQDPNVRHIGPIAQDFYAAFGVGEDERYITTLDADGVALAAIQGLNEVVEENNAAVATALALKNEQIRALTAKNCDLEQRLAALEVTVDRLTAAMERGASD